jgi:predicted histone-like DNA-binding protein
MSLKYRVIPRKNPQDRNAASKYYASATSRGSIDLEQMLDAICEGTTLDRDEARMAINRLFIKTEDFLNLGFNVHLGGLGYMHVTTKSDGVDRPEDATASMIKDIVPRFVFGKKLRDRMRKIQVERETAQ